MCKYLFSEQWNPPFCVLHLTNSSMGKESMAMGTWARSHTHTHTLSFSLSLSLSLPVRTCLLVHGKTPNRPWIESMIMQIAYIRVLPLSKFPVAIRKWLLKYTYPNMSLLAQRCPCVKTLGSTDVAIFIFAVYITYIYYEMCSSVCSHLLCHIPHSSVLSSSNFPLAFRASDFRNSLVWISLYLHFMGKYRFSEQWNSHFCECGWLSG